MQDRYLFKAKRKDNGEWVFGGLSYCDKNGAYFITNMGKDHISYIGFHQEVDSNTICQCTGLKEFYEKDIVKRIDIHKVGDPSIGIIEYDVENTAFVIHWIDKQKYSPMYPWKDKIEVIGNIFDNPELLESKGCD